MVKNHVNSHSSLLYVAYLAAIYLGNPLPPHTTLKYMILFYQFKKIIVYFSPKRQVRETEISFLDLGG